MYLSGVPVLSNPCIDIYNSLMLKLNKILAEIKISLLYLSI